MSIIPTLPLAKKIDVDLDGKESAGFEVSRNDLWGAPIMIELGLTLLPSLRNNNIFASGDDLDVLEHEAQTILKNVELISQHTKYFTEYIVLRTPNFINAVEKAREVNGTVIID